MTSTFSKKNLTTCILHISFMILFGPKGIYVTSTNAPSSSALYTAGTAEEKCVLEEEFHGASSFDLSTNDDEHPWWDECESDGHPGDTSHDDAECLRDNAGRKKKHRWRIWKNKNALDQSVLKADSSSQSEPNTSTFALEDEHPMRTDEWEFDIQLSRLFPNREHDLFPEILSGNDDNKSRRRHRKKQVMQFARNGYVKVLQDDKLTSNNMDVSFVPARSQVQIGKWKIGHSGVVFDIPVAVFPKDQNGEVSDRQQMTVLHYHADIHLNKFGERPRMFRGVITRDRYSSIFPPNFLRPVIGTFSAQGIGIDTADTSYKERGLGLSKQQIIQKQSRG